MHRVRPFLLRRYLELILKTVLTFVMEVNTAALSLDKNENDRQRPSSKEKNPIRLPP
jgi:hypothetical protein